jgi:hypothetical protein
MFSRSFHCGLLIKMLSFSISDFHNYMQYSIWEGESMISKPDMTSLPSPYLILHNQISFLCFFSFAKKWLEIMSRECHALFGIGEWSNPSMKQLFKKEGMPLIFYYRPTMKFSSNSFIISTLLNYYSAVYC